METSVIFLEHVSEKMSGNDACKGNHRGLECHAKKFECFPVGNGTSSVILYTCFLVRYALKRSFQKH